MKLTKLVSPLIALLEKWDIQSFRGSDELVEAAGSFIFPAYNGREINELIKREVEVNLK